MSKFTFKFEEQTISTGNKQTTVEFNALSLNTILNEVTDFLRGCGYQIDGYVDIVNPTGKVNDEFLPNQLAAQQKPMDPLNPDTWPSPKNIPSIQTIDLSSINKDQLTALSTQSLSSIDLSQIRPVDISSITVPSSTTFHHPV